MGRHGLGELPQAVMLEILRLGAEAYGVPIRSSLSQRLKRGVSFSAVYTVLERLEANGFISSYLGDPTPERGGRAKRFYKVEAKGREALNDAHATAQSLWNGALGEVMS